MGNLLNDVVINKLSGGLGRRTPDRDMVSGLVFDIALDNSTPPKPKKTSLTNNPNFTVGTPIRLASLEDAENVGITSVIDTDGCSVYYQVSQFFRINPSGDLWVMGIGATDYKDLVSKSEVLLSDDSVNGEIRQLAVTYSNKDTVFNSLATPDGNSTEEAVGEAAKITEKAFLQDYRPLEIFLEGKGFGVFLKPDSSNDGAIPGVSTAKDLRDLNAPNVSVTIAMDKQKAKDANYNNTAAVGVLLGAVSKAKVSENIAWIEKFNLTGDGFRSVGFVGGENLPTEGDQGTLNAMGYIFTRKHIGIPGVYFNDSHTCTKETDDFAFIESNRTINKAARIARTALLPKLNSPVLVDPETGKLPPSVVKGYETLCRSALERMISNEEASDIDVFVDPDQDILADSRLIVKMAIVPLGTARQIIVNLGFENPFQISAAAAS